MITLNTEYTRKVLKFTLGTIKADWGRPLSHCSRDKGGVESTEREVIEEGDSSFSILHIKPVRIVQELAKSCPNLIRFPNYKNWPTRQLVNFEIISTSSCNNQRRQWSRSCVPWRAPIQRPRRQVLQGNSMPGSSSFHAPVFGKGGQTIMDVKGILFRSKI